MLYRVRLPVSFKTVPPTIVTTTAKRLRLSHPPSCLTTGAPRNTQWTRVHRAPIWRRLSTSTPLSSSSTVRRLWLYTPVFRPRIPITFFITFRSPYKFSPFFFYFPCAFELLTTLTATCRRGPPIMLPCDDARIIRVSILSTSFTTVTPIVPIFTPREARAIRVR